ncbi:hypothetical protein [Tomitella fengzijianii]|uniref:hypothetical protein n=1 Tax=Tomitella fengzijianii TaxID=2597660 RepID=UPI00143D4F99|nr:hypothetical protein [Tomitella fengzijianii]
MYQNRMLTDRVYRRRRLGALIVVLAVGAVVVYVLAVGALQVAVTWGLGAV